MLIKTEKSILKAIGNELTKIHHSAEFTAVMSRQVLPAYTAEDLKHSFKVFWYIAAPAV
jgi:hypothetical protein